MVSGKDENGKVKIYDDFREAYWWLRGNFNYLNFSLSTTYQINTCVSNIYFSTHTLPNKYMCF